MCFAVREKKKPNDVLCTRLFSVLLIFIISSAVGRGLFVQRVHRCAPVAAAVVAWLNKSANNDFGHLVALTTDVETRCRIGYTDSLKVVVFDGGVCIVDNDAADSGTCKCTIESTLNIRSIPYNVDIHIYLTFCI